MIKYSFYLCPLIGTGSMTPTRDPFRSKLNNYAGSSFTSCIFDCKKLDLNTCWAEESIHQAIRIDAEILSLSPLKDSLENLKAWLELGEEIISVPGLLTKLEEKKINTGWFTNQHTNKDMLRYLRKLSMIEQLCVGRWKDLNFDAMDLVLKANLNTTVSQIPANIKNKISTWMSNKGLAVGWIKATTTVREIVHFIIENVSLPGLLKLSEINL